MRRLALACLLLSCGAPQKPTTSDQASAVKTYSPLGIKSDAKAPNQALILGTDGKDGSTIIPLPVAPGNAAVDAIVVQGDGKNVVASLSAVKLATAPNRDGSLHLDGSGAWLGALVAASTLNKDLTDFTFSATGNVDASASGLIAAGFLAAITGAPIDPAATLIGMIDPDGTIGPVDAVPERLRAAIESGKKRIGYPTGMRNATSTKTGDTVDLVALAKAHGAEAVEIADVHAAYKLLTGRTLPAPQPVTVADMAFDASTKAALDAKYKQWQQRLAAQWGAILQLESAGRLPALLVYLRDSSKRLALSAERMHKDGALAAAYSRMAVAAVYATSANQIYDVLASVQTSKLDRATAALDKLDALEQQTAEALQKIGALQPSSLGGHLQMLAAFRAALRGYVYKDFATHALARTKQYVKALAGTPAATLGSEQTAEAVVAQVGPTILYVAKTTAETTLALDQLELANASDVSYAASIPDLLRLATSLQSAGAAGVGYIDATLVEPHAQRAKLSVDDARLAIAAHEPDYLVALMTSKLASLDGAKQLADAWGQDSLAWALFSLAGGELAHLHAATLLAKYDSLGVELDGSLEARRVAHEKALAGLLAAAERNARTNAHAARIATGAIPVQARLAYQLGSAEKNGTLADKLDALAQFWSSSAHSQTAVMLARN